MKKKYDRRIKEKLKEQKVNQISNQINKFWEKNVELLEK